MRVGERQILVVVMQCLLLLTGSHHSNTPHAVGVSLRGGGGVAHYVHGVLMNWGLAKSLVRTLRSGICLSVASGTRVAFRDMFICGQRYARCVPGYVYLWPAVRALRSGICLSVASGTHVAFQDMFICGQRYARCVPGYVYLWPAVCALRSGICLSRRRTFRFYPWAWT